MVALGTLGFSVFMLFVIDSLYVNGADHQNFVRTGYLKHVIVGRRLTGALITRIPGIDLKNCTRECSIRKGCRSINFLSRFPLCELNLRTISDYGTVVVNVFNAVYTEKSFWTNDEIMHHSCNGMTCSGLNSKCRENIESSDTGCELSDCGDVPNIPNATVEQSDGIGMFSKATYTCDNGYEAIGGRSKISCLPNGTWSTTTFQCKEKAHDCLTIKRADKGDTGVYKLQIGDSQISVMCDMDTEGGGWTVLHARFEHNLNYATKTWNEYKLGFGVAGSDYWIGNKYIHLLTKENRSEVYFKLQHSNGTWFHAKYRDFYVASDADKFTLHYRADSYSGTSGDSLYANNNRAFSTMDNDNDNRMKFNCAVERGGGWWFHRCSKTLLTTNNGRWYIWKFNLGNDEPLNASYIMIRH